MKIQKLQGKEGIEGGFTTESWIEFVRYLDDACRMSKDYCLAMLYR